MFKIIVYSLSTAIFLLIGNLSVRAQININFTLTNVAELCEKGRAVLEISGTTGSDSIFVNWSNGEKNILSINNLSAGDYDVRVRVKRKVETKLFIKDTLLNFSIYKEDCAVGVSRFFTPNDDLYNDFLTISNLHYYPNFELEIFNKWGQRVHHQKQSYTPWDGKWLGSDIPDGVYYFVLFYDASNKNKFIKGDITILR